jgi:hypothetical protein
VPTGRPAAKSRQATAMAGKLAPDHPDDPNNVVKFINLYDKIR